MHTSYSIGGSVFGHPKGLFLVSGVELWERFSYYGMLGLLVLFLTSGPETGGFNWPTEMALKLMGIYTGLVFASPAIGGWIANRYLGERKAILLGGLLVLLGHLLLGGPVYLLALIDTLSGTPVTTVLHSKNLNFSSLFASGETISEMLGPKYASANTLGWLTLAYHLKLWSFLAGLVLIVLGTGLIKPAVSSIINHFYPKGGTDRQTGFTIFMVSIYLGSFSANFIAGTLGEKIGWHAGFTAAAIGMAIGVAAYLLGQEKYLSSIGIAPQNQGRSKDRPSKLTTEQKRRICLILYMGLFTVVYAIAFYQKGGLLNLYAQQRLDRSLLGFEVPATWFLSISTGTFILFAPLVARLIGTWLPSFGAFQKLAIGLGLLALGYVLMFLGEWTFDPSGGKASALWLVMTYILFGIADIFVWPPQIAAAAALSPKHLTSFIVGAWYLTIGLGSWFTGYVGALSLHFSHLTTFAIIAASCAFVALIMYATRHWALKMASDIKV